MRKKLPNWMVPFEGPSPGPAPQRKKSPGKPMPSDDSSMNKIVRRDPAGVVRSGDDPRGKVAYEVPKGRKGSR